MTITLTENTIILEDACGVEEVDTLLGFIEAHPGMGVDISGASAMHTALWQVLLMTGVPITGSPRTPFYRDHLVPALQSTQVTDFPQYAPL